MAKKGINIYLRKDKRWEGRYKCGYKTNGLPKYKSVYGNSYNSCKEKLIKAINEQKNEGNSEAATLTVKNIFALWLKKCELTVKESSFHTYKTVVFNHILPAIGDIKISEVTTEFLNDFVFDKLNNGRKDGKGGLSPKTVQNIICIIKTAFRYSEKIYKINNPAEFIKTPKYGKKIIDVLTENEMQKIRNYCANNDIKFSLVYEVAISTGIRIGELCALQKNDIDLERGIISINKTVQRIKTDESSNGKKTKIIISTPKTDTSIRKIPLPAAIISKFEDFFSKNQREQNDFVFSTDGKKPFDERTLQKRFAKILEKCEVRKVKFHTLRHTFATKWASSNYDIKSLSEILGHSSVNITLSLYVHPSVESKRKFINELYAA